MNDEIGNFLIKFTTEGFDKVEKSLDALNKGMDKLNDSFEKGHNKGESFFGALLKWDIVVGTITKSFRALKQEIGNVFDAAENMTTIFRKEQMLGVEAKVLERYGKIAELNQGSQQDAYAFFENIQNLMLKASTPALWGESDAKDLALAGINWSYQRLSSDKMQNMVLNRDAFLVALRQAFLNNMDDPDRMSMLKKYVGQESLYSWFMSPDESFNAQMNWAEGQRVFTTDPSKLQDVQDLRVEKLEWKNFFDKIDLMLAKPMADVLKALEGLQKPMEGLVEKLSKWVNENSDKIAGWVEDAVDWLVNTFPEYWSKFVYMLETVSKVISDIYDYINKKGVIGKTWDSIKMVYDTAKLGVKAAIAGIKGEDISAEMDAFADKYAVDGSGGYLGAVARGAADRIAPQSNVYNLGDTVVVEAGWHDQKVINPRNNVPNGAMIPSINK